MSQVRTNLAMSRKEAEEKIAVQIQEGNQIGNFSIESSESLRKVRSQYYKWNDFNATLLEKMFDSNEISNKYQGIGVSRIAVVHPGERHSLGEEVQEFRRDIRDKIDRLESIKNRLELYEEPRREMKEGTIEHAEILSNRIFIVHGRDEGPKQSVARLLGKLGLEPIILHEQPNKGRTVIEKFEDYSDVGYAVVLLTPDDMGGLKSEKGEPDLRPRARQNVVFEQGFFVGKLRRSRVCALLAKDVEQPSDMSGVLYISLDENNAWELRLAKELKAAGYDIDLNML
jgi:predicted nucleotide-binding protein